MRDDSPHIAVSAGSGAGKSVLAQLIAVQILARGGRVTILDRKGAHRWALGQPGVDYCTRPEQMHDALICKAVLADERNTLAMHEEDDWDPGPRHLVICEELNATIGQLMNHWAEVREKGEPKRSPAVAALADAWPGTRRTTGRYWCPRPPCPGPLVRWAGGRWPVAGGRWPVVIGGQATEVQVAYLTSVQSRALASPPEDLDRPLSMDVPGDGDMMTLRDAIDAGVLPWSYDPAKKRLQRRVGKVPSRRGKRGTADLYARADLVAWADSGDRVAAQFRGRS